jgi:hypothetical protein
MIHFLLNFLGINSWYIDFCIVKKRKINLSFKKCNKNLKTINILKLLEDETPSPRLALYTIKRCKTPTDIQRLKFSIYTVYFLLILILICIQPMYTLIMYVNNPSNLKYLSSFFLHLNLPLIYIWSKWYFKTNHINTNLKCKKFKVFITTLSATLSIIFNFLDITSFYNEYYWLNTFASNNNILFFSLIVVEWIYSRLIIFLFVYCFIFVMNNHILKFKKIVKDIDHNEFNFEDNTCLSNIINELAIIRYELEITISFYNNIISITTLFGGIALGIFIRDVIPNKITSLSDINFEPHDRYLLHPLALYLISQLILIINMTRYSIKRDEVLKYIKSINFMNRFLSRISSEKIMRKSGNNISMVMLNITEESATTLDWIVLGNMLSEKWLDFSILGISTSDGQLIKKGIAVCSAMLFVISFLQNNN